MRFIPSYQNAFMRFVYSLFIQTPLKLWFRFLSLAIPSDALFVNYTGLPFSTLSNAWMDAQTNLATQSFPLSELSTGIGNHAPDPRAKTVLPSNVAVISCPDEPIANLIKVNPAWSKDKDPSGSILWLQGLNYETVHAITMPWTRPRVYAAASELPAVLSYEFENIILSKLGYDVSNR
jgi:hypothetical protein